MRDLTPKVHPEGHVIGPVDMEPSKDAAAGQDRLYNVLAYFDTRDGSEMADLVRSAREGWERSGPGMDETGAWDEFDARWAERSGRMRP